MSLSELSELEHFFEQCDYILARISHCSRFTSYDFRHLYLHTLFGKINKKKFFYSWRSSLGLVDHAPRPTEELFETLFSIIELKNPQLHILIVIQIKIDVFSRGRSLGDDSQIPRCYEKLTSWLDRDQSPRKYTE